MTGDLTAWLDAVYVAWVEAPGEVLEKAMDLLTRHHAAADPEDARATWGLRPEHRAKARGLGQGPDATGSAPKLNAKRGG